MSEMSAPSTSANGLSFRSFAEFASSSWVRLSIIGVVITLLLGGGIYTSHRISQQRALQERLDKLDKFTAESLAEEVEAIQSQIGRSPKDEAELEMLLARPMPVVHDYGTARFIHYERTSKDSFLLEYELWDTAKWAYDSTQPQAGWVQHWE